MGVLSRAPSSASRSVEQEVHSEMLAMDILDWHSIRMKLSKGEVYLSKMGVRSLPSLVRDVSHDVTYGM